jgi:hypothetical protein
VRFRALAIIYADGLREKAERHKELIKRLTQEVGGKKAFNYQGIGCPVRKIILYLRMTPSVSQCISDNF